MPYKKKAIVRRYPKKVAPKPKFKASQLAVAIKRELSKNIETKRSSSTATDGQQIGHNSFIFCDSEILATTNGTGDPSTGATANRIGDEINLKGVAFKMMLENNQRFNDVSFRILVVKGAKGDTPTTATLFNGLSGNKMMDTFNNERYTLIFSKYVKVKAGNASTTSNAGTEYISSGLQDGDSGLVKTASTRIVKFYIPGSRFVKNGLVRYESAIDQVKFYDFHVILYAYAVGATSQAIGWDVGVLNEYIKVMYFKDA